MAERRSMWGRLGSLALKLAFVLAASSVLVTLALRWVAPPTSAFMIQHRLGDSQARLENRWVAWEQISPHVALAVVAAEDQKFPRHRGFDVDSIQDAVEAHAAGAQLRGASTISQQVAKNLFLWPQQSFVRKGIEAWFTALIELLWPKQRILEVYLNVAEFGPGIYGVGAASEIYFGKSAAGLWPAEAALLAAVLPSPQQLSVTQPSAYVRERQAWILAQMRGLGGPAYLEITEQTVPGTGLSAMPEANAKPWVPDFQVRDATLVTRRSVAAAHGWRTELSGICLRRWLRTSELANASDSPRLDAEVLLAGALGRPRSYLYARPEEALSPAQAQAFTGCIARRAEVMPVAYLTSVREFFSSPTASMRSAPLREKRRAACAPTAGSSSSMAKTSEKP